MRFLMEKTYTWEEIMDVQDDLLYSMDDIEGDYEGTIKVQVLYDEDRYSLEDWEE